MRNIVAARPGAGRSIGRLLPIPDRLASAFHTQWRPAGGIAVASLAACAAGASVAVHQPPGLLFARAASSTGSALSSHYCHVWHSRYFKWHRVLHRPARLPGCSAPGFRSLSYVPRHLHSLVSSSSAQKVLYVRQAAFPGIISLVVGISGGVPRPSLPY